MLERENYEAGKQGITRTKLVAQKTSVEVRVVSTHREKETLDYGRIYSTVNIKQPTNLCKYLKGLQEWKFSI